MNTSLSHRRTFAVESHVVPYDPNVVGTSGNATQPLIENGAIPRCPRDLQLAAIPVVDAPMSAGDLRDRSRSRPRISWAGRRTLDRSDRKPRPDPGVVRRPVEHRALRRRSTSDSLATQSE